MVIRTPDGKQRRQPVEERTYTIGRGSDADVYLPSPSASRRHAILRPDENQQWIIEDLGSRNGTTVNDEPVKGIRPLNVGDKITIAEFVINWLDETVITSEATATGSQLAQDEEPSIDSLISLKDVPTPHVAATHLSTLVSFGRSLLATAEPQDRLDGLCRMMTTGDFAGHLALVVDVPIEGGDATKICGPISRYGFEPPERYLSNTVLNAVRLKQQSVLGTNVSSGETPDVMMSIDMSAMQAAVMACPIHKTKEHTRILYVLTTTEYGTAEWLAVADLAAEQFTTSERVWEQKIAIQRKAALERDIEQARQLQRSLLPIEVDTPGLETSLRFEPSREVAGDFVDIVPLDDGQVVLAVADVRGKGMPAAMVASSIHSILRASISSGIDLFATFDALNHYLYDVLPDGHFVTMVGLTLDPTTGQCLVIQAGHPPALAVNPDGSRELKAADTFALGIVPDLDLQPIEEILQPGEAVALYSDGITETVADDGKWLGHRRVGELLSKAMQGSVQPPLRDVTSTLFDQIDNMESPVDHDDRVLMLAQRSS